MASETGFYMVGGTSFKSKIEALVYATPTKADVSWWFYDHIWDKINWNIEPELSISAYYKIRAQQIRDEYDYVILMFSGGADSTNVAWAFLNNKIKIDEIIAGAPLSGLKNFDQTNATIDATNIISETEYAQWPGLKEISQYDPNIKITIHDYFEDMTQIKSQEWLYGLSHWFNPSVLRHRLEKFSHIKELAEKGKKVAILYGIDKPTVCRGSSGNLYCTISDNSVNFLGPHFDKHYDNVDTVLFYFTPNLPHMLVKEAWEIFKFFYRPENTEKRNKFMWHYDKPWSDPHIRSSIYQRTIVPAIYPDVAARMSTRFQAHKPAWGFTGNGEIDSWYYKLHKNERFVDMWHVDTVQLLNFIDEKYKHPISGFLTYYKWWSIGHESQFMTIS